MTKRITEKQLAEARVTIRAYQAQQDADLAALRRRKRGPSSQPDPDARKPLREGFVRVEYIGPKGRGVIVGPHHIGAMPDARPFVDLHESFVAANKFVIDSFVEDGLLKIETEVSSDAS